jgi:serine/threonine protein kinase
VLKLYHSFEDDAYFYIVSELCEGGTLLDYILSKENGLEEEEICKIIWQLMSAVTLAHSKKIVHRDIKPENILLEESDHS